MALAVAGEIVFKEIDPLAYVMTHLILAQIVVKHTYVTAVRGTPGQIVHTHSHGLYETSNRVAVDRYTRNPDWIVTHNSGEKMIVPDRDFSLLYTKVNNDTSDNKYFPISQQRISILLDENVQFMAPWNEIQQIKKGGRLIIISTQNIYGIQENEFNEYYDVIEDDGRNLGPKYLNKILNDQYWGNRITF